jgi:hypothetical protein
MGYPIREFYLHCSEVLAAFFFHVGIVRDLRERSRAIFPPTPGGNGGMNFSGHGFGHGLSHDYQSASVVFHHKANNTSH